MSGSDAGAAESQLQAQQAAAITKGTQNIDQAFSGFTPSFYNQRAQDYVDYAMPQLTQQEQQVGQNLDYSLADKGLSNSSAASNAESNLNQDYAIAQQGVVNSGTQQAQQLQQQVQGQENTLVGELQNSVSPNTVAQGAVGTAASLSGPSTFAPIANAFNNFSNQYIAGQTAGAVNPYLYSNPMMNLSKQTAGATASATNNYQTQ